MFERYSKSAKALMDLPAEELFSKSKSELMQMFRAAAEGMTKNEREAYYDKWVAKKCRELELNDEEDRVVDQFAPTMSLYMGDFEQYIDREADKDENGWQPLKPGTPEEIRAEYTKATRYYDVMDLLGISVD